jgi:ribonuclease VapC
VAILTGEPERGRFIDAIVASARPLMSAFNHFETRTVLLRRSGEGPLRELQEFLDASQVEVRTFDLAQASGALDAYRRFGRGSGHKARLNLGDCAAYALARSLDLPLLFKGEDFTRTDVRLALA